MAKTKKSWSTIIGSILIISGLLVVGGFFGQMYMADKASERQRADTVSVIEREFASTQTNLDAPTDVKKSPAKPRQRTESSSSVPASAEFTRPLESGSVIGLLRVPRLGEDYAQPIVEGTGEVELSDAVGRLAYTALPGEEGNFYIAGHRVTHGRPFYDIENIKIGDTITVETKRYVYTYRVYTTAIVKPTDIEVSAPIPGKEMDIQPDGQYISLQACHPEHSAVQRYLVHGKLEDTRVK